MTTLMLSISVTRFCAPVNPAGAAASFCMRKRSEAVAIRGNRQKLKYNSTLRAKINKNNQINKEIGTSRKLFVAAYLASSGKTPGLEPSMSQVSEAETGNGDVARPFTDAIFGHAVIKPVLVKVRGYFRYQDGSRISRRTMLAVNHDNRPPMGRI